jgi:uncharacterized protein (TIGR03086 family)
VSIPELFKRAIDEFDKRVQQIGDDQWDNRTPCPDWSVRDLVNHLVTENVWVPPLLDGKTIAEVGNQFDGDLLGADPKKAWTAAAEEALSAAEQPGAMEATAHLSFGDFSGDNYVSQVLCDHVIHAWDLARGIGADDGLDPELVAYADRFFSPILEAYRAAGAFGPAAEVPADSDDQTKLLANAGRKA